MTTSVHSKEPIGRFKVGYREVFVQWGIRTEHREEVLFSDSGSERVFIDSKIFIREYFALDEDSGKAKSKIIRKLIWVNLNRWFLSKIKKCNISISNDELGWSIAYTDASKSVFIYDYMDVNEINEELLNISNEISKI